MCDAALPAQRLSHTPQSIRPDDGSGRRRRKKVRVHAVRHPRSRLSAPVSPSYAWDQSRASSPYESGPDKEADLGQGATTGRAWRRRKVWLIVGCALVAIVLALGLFPMPDAEDAR